MNTDLYLRKLQLNLIEERRQVIFVYLPPVSNFQLLTMYRRKLTILNSKMVYRFVFYSKGLLKKLNMYYECNSSSNEYFEFTNTKPTLSFSEDEEIKGHNILTQYGLKDSDWFVCVHSRDHIYLKQEGMKKNLPFDHFSYHDYRDFNINSLIPAINYILSKGGFVFLMGHSTSKLELPITEQIVDYRKDRNDFMDVFLCAKCRFFLGNTSGLYLVSEIFNVPSACTNFIPLPHTPISRRDLFIPKKLKDLKSNKILTYQESYERNLIAPLFSNLIYQNENISPQENTPEEILNLCQEMFIQTEDDKEPEISNIQKQYQEKILSSCTEYAKNSVYSGRISNSFVIKNKKLFDPLILIDK